MNNSNDTFQDLLSRQIKIRDLQERWRNVSSLSITEIEQLWAETAKELDEEMLLIDAHGYSNSSNKAATRKTPRSA